jgi:hypothetical protein
MVTLTVHRQVGLTVHYLADRMVATKDLGSDQSILMEAD